MCLAVLWLILTCLFIFICRTNDATHFIKLIVRMPMTQCIYAMGINFHFHGICKSLLVVGVGIYCALLSIWLLLLLFRAPTIHSRIQADVSHPHRPMLCKKILLMMNRRLLVGGFFFSFPLLSIFGWKKS